MVHSVFYNTTMQPVHNPSLFGTVFPMLQSRSESTEPIWIYQCVRFKIDLRHTDFISPLRDHTYYAKRDYHWSLLTDTHMGMKQRMWIGCNKISPLQDYYKITSAHSLSPCVGVCPLRSELSSEESNHSISQHQKNFEGCPLFLDLGQRSVNYVSFYVSFNLLI